MALDIATLQAALIGYQAKHDELTARMAEIRKRIRHGGDEPFPLIKGSPSARKKRKISAAARKRIAAAQKKRWAAFHKSKKVAAVSAVPKAKRRISEEGLKRIIAATKKRWAAKRAAAAK
jgi:aminopeptidase N